MCTVEKQNKLKLESLEKIRQLYDVKYKNGTEERDNEILYIIRKLELDLKTTF